MIKQRGRPHVIKLSAQSAGLTPPVSFGTMHREAETAVEQSGLPYTILRPTFFQQSLLLFAEDVAKKKRIIAPVGSGRVAMVDVSDVARTAAAVVCRDDHYNKTYVLTGPSAHSFWRCRRADVGRTGSRNRLHEPAGLPRPTGFAHDDGNATLEIETLSSIFCLRCAPARRKTSAQTSKQ